MADNQFTSQKVLVSQYNEAGFQIARLNVLWMSCNNFCRVGRLDSWKWTLDRIWIELSPDANKKDESKKKKGKKYFDEVKELNEKVAETKNRAGLYNALQEKEIFLRILQDDVGKGAKRTTEYGDIM